MLIKNYLIWCAVIALSYYVLLNGLVVLGVLIFSVVIGSYFFYKSRQYDIKLLSYLGIMIFFMGFMWLGPIVDFATIVFTTVNLDNSNGLYGILSYMWVPIPLVSAMLITAHILLPERKWLIVSIYVILGIFFEFLVFFDWGNSFIFNPPASPGDKLIDARFNVASPAFILIAIFDFSVLFNGIGFLRKGIQTRGIIRKKNWYLSIGFFIFVFFTYFDIFSFPGFNEIYIIRIGINFCFLFFYLGLKEESVKPKKLQPKKQAKIEDSLFFFTEEPRQNTEELIEENPVVLLIITAGGVLIFSYSFVEEWERDNEMFGNFLSAFTSFSDEFFSEEFDRAKFGQYTVLMEPMPNFSICYLFKGQTFLAAQKLAKFAERIQNTRGIWETLEKYHQACQVLELKTTPMLESLIKEIFKENSPDLKPNL